MKNSRVPSKRRKNAAAYLVICFVALIAITGVFVFSNYERGKEPQQLAEGDNSTNTNEKEQTEETESKDIQNEMDNDILIEYDYIDPDTEESQSVSDAGKNTSALAFSAEDILEWPVDGNVLMNYSMDQTVYFATLDQYKYNPAVIIEGKVGDKVIAAARGIVKSIEETAQTGTTVTLEMGNGYEAVYGQLKEVVVLEGTYMEQGEIVGYLNEPTKYYSVEGCNLYFQLLKDGEPVNPLEYLDY